MSMVVVPVRISHPAVPSHFRITPFTLGLARLTSSPGLAHLIGSPSLAILIGSTGVQAAREIAINNTGNYNDKNSLFGFGDRDPESSPRARVLISPMALSLIMVSCIVTKALISQGKRLSMIPERN